MPGTIVAPLQAPNNRGPFTSRFKVYNYCDLSEQTEVETLNQELGDWFYLNSAGYAQKYNPDRPPSKYPTPGRLILTPEKN